MAFSDYEHCHYCVADKEAGRPLPERHGYKGLYTGDTEVPDHINVICSHHLRVLKDEIYDLRNKVTELSAPKPQILPNDLDHLDPGIKDLVLTLRDKGVKTTDSGDGVSKLPGGYWSRLGFQPYKPDDVIPNRHVVMVVDSSEAVGPTLDTFLHHAGEGWSFEIFRLPLERWAMCIAAFQQRVKFEPLPVLDHAGYPMPAIPGGET